MLNHGYITYITYNIYFTVCLILYLHGYIYNFCVASLCKNFISFCLPLRILHFHLNVAQLTPYFCLVIHFLFVSKWGKFKWIKIKINRLNAYIFYAKTLIPQISSAWNQNKQRIQFQKPHLTLFSSFLLMVETNKLQ